MKRRLSLVVGLVCALAATSRGQQCVGDLDGNQRVTADEILYQGTIGAP